MIKRLISVAIVVAMVVTLNAPYITAATLDKQGTINVSSTPGTNGDWVGLSTITCTYNDALMPAGYDPAEYRIEVKTSGAATSNWTLYTETNKPTVDTEGITSLEARAVRIADTAVIGEVSRKMIYVDKTAPVYTMDTVGPLLIIRDMDDILSGFSHIEFTITASTGAVVTEYLTTTDDYVFALEENVTYAMSGEIVDNADNASVITRNNIRANSTSFTAPTVTVTPDTDWINTPAGISVTTVSPTNDWRYELINSSSGSTVKVGGSTTNSLGDLSDGEYELKVHAFHNLAPDAIITATKEIKVDTVPPVLTLTQIKGTNTPPGIVASATDAQSKVKSIMYTVNGSALKSAPSGTTLYAENEGSNVFQIYALDNASNKSTEQSVTINWDPGNLAPTIKVSGESNELKTWYNKETTLAIGAANAVKGLSKILVEVNGEFEQITGSGEKLSGTYKLENEGTFHIEATAYDASGAISGSTTSKDVGIDKTIPTVPAITLSGNTITIRPGSDELSGVSHVEYSISGTESQDTTNEEYSGPIVISEDGTVKITAVTVDLAGNKSREVSKELKVDTTPPEPPTFDITALVSDTGGGGGNQGGTTVYTDWYTTPVNVAIQHGKDDISGADYTEYSLSGATKKDWTTISSKGAGSIVISNIGVTTIKAITYDKNGNCSDEATVKVKIDSVKPKMTATPLTRLEVGSVVFKVSLSVTDDISGVKEVLYTVDGGDEKEIKWDPAKEKGTVTITLRPTEGDTERVINVMARDHAGNVVSEEIFSAISNTSLTDTTGDIVGVSDGQPTAGSPDGYVPEETTNQVSVNPGTGRR